MFYSAASSTSSIKARFENIAKQNEEEDKKRAEEERARRQAKEKEEQEEALKKQKVLQNFGWTYSSSDCRMGS